MSAPPAVLPRPRLPQDAGAGMIFVAIGLIAAWQVRRLPIGTLTAMGPGYFPLILSVLLVVLGLLSVLKAMIRPGARVQGRWPLLPLVVLVVGVASFGLLIEQSGLLPAVFVLAVLMGFGDLRRHPFQVVAAACVITLAAVLVFAQFLGMPIPVW